MSYYDQNSLNDLDVAEPMDGASPQELLLAFRQLKAIVKNALLTSHYPDGRIRGGVVSSVSAGSVGTLELKDAAVTSVKLANGSVLSAHLAANSVTTDKILNGAVTAEKIAAGALGTIHFAENSIPLSALQGYITRDYISQSPSTDALRAITENAIANEAVVDRAIKSMSVAKLLGGSNGNLLLKVSDVWTAVAITGDLTYDSGTNKFVLASGVKGATVGDTKTRGTDGGAGVAASWNIRTLGEISDTDNLLTFSSNRFSLIKGKYLIYITCPASGVGKHQARLFDYTGSAPVIWGSSEISAAGNASKSVICGMLTVTDETKQFQVEHYIQNTVGSTDLGAAASSDNTTAYGTHREIYTFGYIARIG